MSNIIIPKTLDMEEKLALMNEDAKYEVGTDSEAENMALLCAGHIKGKAPPPKIPKLFLSSACIFNCAYCGCRSGLDERPTYCHRPSELAKIAIAEARRNGHGVFVSSAIVQNADYTQELLAECVRIMREEYCYQGFIHAKVMPGADPLLIERTGKYADRLSVNIEVAQSAGYKRIAKQKNKTNILTPMGSISRQIQGANYERRKFATSQTTQLMAGSTNEDDRTIMTLTNALYKKYRLRRIYYTAFHYRQEAKGYENEHLQITQTPYWRMARLYQADRLMQLYGFSADDVTPQAEPYLYEDIDPKAAWALRHPELYPVELNKADFDTLIRIPGIGITSAKRIIEARRHCMITHDLLKKMRVSLKRSIFFILCNGQYQGGHIMDSPYFRSVLKTGRDELSIGSVLTADEQISLFQS
jgi:predicted DNA-binding helix-hairpin-helix protein